MTTTFCSAEMTVPAMMGSWSGRIWKVTPHLHGRLERYPTDMMIKLMDRGFALDAIVLSFVADDGDRSGDELSVVDPPTPRPPTISLTPTRWFLDIVSRWIQRANYFLQCSKTEWWTVKFFRSWIQRENRDFSFARFRRLSPSIGRFLISEGSVAPSVSPKKDRHQTSAGESVCGSRFCFGSRIFFE
jgi:hypothetical protein